MTMSNALSGRYRPVLEAFAVSEERPDDVDAASGQGEDGLLVVLPFSAFPGVVSPRGRTVNGRGLGREVAGAQQSSIVASGPVMVAADSAGVTRDRGYPGDAGESVGILVVVLGSAGRGEEFGGELHTKPRDAQQYFGVFMISKPGLYLGLDLLDLIVQAQDLSRDLSHEHRGRCLPGYCGVLAVSRLHSGRGKKVCPANSLFAQPVRGSDLACFADPVRAPLRKE